MPSASVGVSACRAVLLSAAVTLLVLAADSAATPRQSAPDQYEQQPSPPPRSDHPKLHRVNLAHTGYHRFGLLPTNIQQQHPDTAKVPELQVGCAEGSLHERKTDTKQVLKNPMKIRYKRQTESRRQNQGVIHWFDISQPQISSQAVVQSYQLRSNVPHYIPLWGNPSRVPVFFPTKPILFNPGYPANNRPQQLTPTPNINVTIETRIRDERPSWGVVEPSTTSRPAISVRPSKRPAPPLMHKPSISDDQAQSSIPQELVIAQNINQVFTSPPPSTQQPISQSSGGASEVTSGGASGGNADAGLNRCVWAIISCCNPASTQVKSSCFEQLGCPGAFWDRSPCSREVTVAALNVAQKYYDQS